MKSNNYYYSYTDGQCLSARQIADQISHAPLEAPICVMIVDHKQQIIISFKNPLSAQELAVLDVIMGPYNNPQEEKEPYLSPFDGEWK